MSDFMERPSPLYSSTVKALRELMKQEGLDSVECAYAEIARGARSKMLAEAKGMKRSQPRYANCLAPLLGKRHDLSAPNGECEFCDPLKAEHYALFKKNGEPAYFVMQPYNLSWENMNVLAEFCRKHSLRASVSAKASWQFPGRTLAIVIARQRKGTGTGS